MFQRTLGCFLIVLGIAGTLYCLLVVDVYVETPAGPYVLDPGLVDSRLHWTIGCLLLTAIGAAVAVRARSSRWVVPMLIGAAIVVILALLGSVPIGPIRY